MLSIHKKNDFKNCSNYRGITPNKYTRKVRILEQRPDVNNWNNIRGYGLRRGKSTEGNETIRRKKQ